jgi:hypothetical protein
VDLVASMSLRGGGGYPLPCPAVLFGACGDIFFERHAGDF